MAITFDNAGQSDISDNTESPDFFSFNNAGNFMYAALDWNSGSNDVTSVDFNGANFTPLFNDGGNRLWVGYLTNPDIGNFTVTLTRDGGNQRFRLGVISFFGVDPVTPIGGSNSLIATGTGSPQTVHVTTSGTGIVVDALGSTRWDSATATAPQITKINVTGTWGSTVSKVLGMSYQDTTGVDTAMQWSLSGSTPTPEIKLFAFELMPFISPSTFIPQMSII